MIPSMPTYTPARHVMVVVPSRPTYIHDARIKRRDTKGYIVDALTEIIPAIIR